MNDLLVEFTMHCPELNAKLVVLKNKETYLFSNDGISPFLVDYDILTDIKINPDKAYAKLHGVSTEHYLLFKEFINQENKCCHKTVEGKPCRQRFFSKSYLNRKKQRPKDWTPGLKTYCTVHEHAIKTKYEEVLRVTSGLH